MPAQTAGPAAARRVSGITDGRTAGTVRRLGKGPGRPLVDTVVALAMRPAVPELRVAAGHPCECAFLGYAL